MKSVKLTTSQFIEKAKLRHGERYDYSLVDYNGAKSKVDIICHRHGLFNQTATGHLRGGGCGKCVNNIKLTTEQFIERGRLKHGECYDYSLVKYVNKSSKVDIICQVHGVFSQRAENHLRGDRCPSCTNNKRLTKAEFIKKSVSVHGERYDYSLVEYSNNSKKVKIICLKHGVFEQGPNNHLNGNGCPRCKESKGELSIREFLIKNEIVFVQQHRFETCRNVLPLPFDFYLPNHKTCIEFNGRQHYVPIRCWGGDEGLKNLQICDNIKKTYCDNNKITLLTIKYTDNIIDKLKILIHPES
jgi:hypothetical protein